MNTYQAQLGSHEFSSHIANVADTIDNGESEISKLLYGWSDRFDISRLKNQFVQAAHVLKNNLGLEFVENSESVDWFTAWRNLVKRPNFMLTNGDICLLFNFMLTISVSNTESERFGNMTNDQRSTKQNKQSTLIHNMLFEIRYNGNFLN